MSGKIARRRKEPGRRMVPDLWWWMGSARPPRGSEAHRHRERALAQWRAAMAVLGAVQRQARHGNNWHRVTRSLERLARVSRVPRGSR